MQENIITAIYRKYLDNAFEGIYALNCDDLRIAYVNLEEFEKKYNISLSEHNDISLSKKPLIRNLIRGKIINSSKNRPPNHKFKQKQTPKS